MEYAEKARGDFWGQSMILNAVPDNYSGLGDRGITVKESISCQNQRFSSD